MNLIKLLLIIKIFMQPHDREELDIITANKANI
jgi:hypothetical protein